MKFPDMKLLVQDHTWKKCGPGLTPKTFYCLYQITSALEGLRLKLQYSGHLMQRAESLEKTLMLGKTAGRRRG